MVKYMVIHCKHEGCYDFQYFEDENTKTRLTSITINPPKIFLFNSKEEAHEFFNDYMNDIDVIDPKCKKNEDIEHNDYCSCGITETDDEDNPILFYNKRNQLFLVEHAAQVFTPPQHIKEDVSNMNLTNKLIRTCRNLGREQKQKYIELGKMCEECMDS